MSAAQLAAVLDRLGPPSRVGRRRASIDLEILGDKLKPVGHRAVEQIKAAARRCLSGGSRGIAARVRGISHDWRLAYVAFGLFAFGMIAFPLFPAFLIASYFAARAQVSLARERGEALGARKWLVYPPMVIVSIVLLSSGSGRLLPAVASLNRSRASCDPEAGGKHRRLRRVSSSRWRRSTRSSDLSAWWIILSLDRASVPKVPATCSPVRRPSSGRIRCAASSSAFGNGAGLLALEGRYRLAWLKKCCGGCKESKDNHGFHRGQG